jgi:hypothetical protein
MAGAKIDYSDIFTVGSEFENLVRQAVRLNLPLSILPETIDVDLSDDLVTLVGLVRGMAYERHYNTRVFPAFTAAVIDDLGIGVERSSDDTRSKTITVTPKTAEASA